MSELAFLSATQLARKIRSKEISAVELLQHYLDRVDRFNPDLNAIVVDFRDAALKVAATADVDLANDKTVGPLHGVPMTVKESYHVAGTPSTWGNPDLKNNRPGETAESLQRLQRAGVNIFGKTNVPLALADFQSYNEVYGTTNNPYDLSRGPGGSSGGSSAALAAGLTGLETGSDIGGSIRNPAHFCGVFGHKPTHGLLWMKGHSAVEGVRATPDISVIGPLARSADDLVTAIKTMAGPDDIAARGLSLNLPELGDKATSSLRVGVWQNDSYAPVSKEVEDRVVKVAQALADEGAQIDYSARPQFTPEDTNSIYQLLLQATMASRKTDAEYQGIHDYLATLAADDDRPSTQVLRNQIVSFRAWSQANEKRHKLRWLWHEFFKDYDVLLAPVMATAAFKHDHKPFAERTTLVDNQERPYGEQVFWSGLTGVAYLPSTVIPTGLNEQGLPIGVQIIGPEFGDLLTIGLAQRLEAAGFCFEPPKGYC